MDRAGTFEDRLLAELMPLVGSVQPETPVARPEPGWRALRHRVGPSLRPPPRRVVALVGMMATLMAAVVVASALWPHRLTSAYAVEDQPDGTIVLTVNDLSDPAGLQQELVDRHVPAVVLVMDPAVPCSDRAQNIPAPGAVQGRPDHPNVLVIRPALLPRDGTVLLGLSSIPGAGTPADGNAAGSGTTGQAGATGSPGNGGGRGPAATGPARSPGPVVVYFTVVRGPAPGCFPGVVQVRLVPPTS